MKRFVAQLTDGDHINVPADRMELLDNNILAYDGGNLVAVVDMGATITAHISEKYEDPPLSPTDEPEPPQIQPIPQHHPQKEQSPAPAGEGYKGFLYIKCEECGTVKGFCAKAPIRQHRCSCGHKTTIGDLKPMYVKCKCGVKFKYMTNITEGAFTMDCFICGSPVDLELHEKKNEYVTIE